MPIKKERAHLYPPEWPEIRRRILRRADNKCEVCGLPQYAVGHRNKNGEFVPLSGNAPCDAAGQGLHHPSMKPLTYAEAREFAALYNTDLDANHPQDYYGNRWFVIVLTVAHLNHDETDSREENLAAWCQRDHLRHDAEHHKKNAARTRANKNRDPNTLEMEFGESAST